MSEPFTFGSLFAGIGGFDLGFERAGMECKWQVEIDPYCQKILEKHWPDVPKYSDVFDLRGSSLSPVDAICGGFPCQPVSLAGRRKGQSDPRWLWPEYARLVAEIRPRYVIVENVPGLRSLGGYEVISDLATLGYECEWDSLSAQAVGAPHKRERVIIVAYPDSQRRQQESDGEGGVSGIVADPYGSGLARREAIERTIMAYAHSTTWRSPRRSGEEVQRSGSLQRSRRRGRLLRHPGWGHDPAEIPESQLGGVVDGVSSGLDRFIPRVASGVPNRKDRLRSLGNALVPQVAEVVGRAIMNRERELQTHAT